MCSRRSLDHGHKIQANVSHSDEADDCAAHVEDGVVAVVKRQHVSYHFQVLSKEGCWRECGTEKRKQASRVEGYKGTDLSIRTPNRR